MQLQKLFDPLTNKKVYYLEDGMFKKKDTGKKYEQSNMHLGLLIFYKSLFCLSMF